MLAFVVLGVNHAEPQRSVRNDLAPRVDFQPDVLGDDFDSAVPQFDDLTLGETVDLTVDQTQMDAARFVGDDDRDDFDGRVFRGLLLDGKDFADEVVSGVVGVDRRDRLILELAETVYTWAASESGAFCLLLGFSL